MELSVGSDYCRSNTAFTRGIYYFYGISALYRLRISHFVFEEPNIIH